MTEELFFDVSIAYQDSPDLRVTWLENLAKHHTDRKNYDEAAQSRILMAALVVQRLMELADYPERGCIFFSFFLFFFFSFFLFFFFSSREKGV